MPQRSRSSHSPPNLVHDAPDDEHERGDDAEVQPPELAFEPQWWVVESFAEAHGDVGAVGVVLPESWEWDTTAPWVAGGHLVPPHRWSIPYLPPCVCVHP